MPIRVMARWVVLDGPTGRTEMTAKAVGVVDLLASPLL